MSAIWSWSCLTWLDEPSMAAAISPPVFVKLAVRSEMRCAMPSSAEVAPSRPAVAPPHVVVRADVIERAAVQDGDPLGRRAGDRLPVPTGVVGGLHVDRAVLVVDDRDGAVRRGRDGVGIDADLAPGAGGIAVHVVVEADRVIAVGAQHGDVLEGAGQHLPVAAEVRHPDVVEGVDGRDGAVGCRRDLHAAAADGDGGRRRGPAGRAGSSRCPSCRPWSRCPSRRRPWSRPRRRPPPGRPGSGRT